MPRARPVLLGIGAGLAALLLVYVLGPRVGVDAARLEALRAPALPSEPSQIDAYLAESERGFPDIRPGHEKLVVWAAPAAPARTEWAIVYLHGFSASRGEIDPVCARVAERLGANVFYTRLRGHGRSGAAMAEAEAVDWFADALEALAVGQRIGRRVVVVGTSTGATLAAWLATRDEAEDVAAFVMVSPNFRVANPFAGLMLGPWGPQIMRLVLGPENHFEPENELHARFWTTRYPSSALMPMMEVVQVAENIELGALEQPLLLLHASGDVVVDSATAAERFAEWGAPGKRRVLIEDSRNPSQHVIAGDALSPETTDAVVEHIVEFVRGRSVR
ncbi:alpha/beta hydrolase [Haliangium ochraceum]|uniref:Serine aminopeptidase S33 domain-containing protein n=1 Tax=Haliangium ochraceum (strain DSM 14365 / JCM 11303 / SMP-2) TaxID=502025 RepID=D0LW69_HALO1|nr:alpha/beta fold hydrolase [Haliangium ochraceum]ACY16001.1 conserved hypothetical protein [Haliangium ochraceum DSM 14365]